MNRYGPPVTTPSRVDPITCTFQCGPMVAMTQKRSRVASATSASATPPSAGIRGRRSSSTSAAAPTRMPVCSSTIQRNRGSATRAIPRACSARWCRRDRRIS